MKLTIQERSVGGYLFYTEIDAAAARTEQQKVEYLEARIDYSNPESIQYVYDKTIQERIFKTPVGLQYLKHLQDFLLEQPGIDPDTVRDIPLFVPFDGEFGEKPKILRNEEPSNAATQELEKGKSRFRISVLLNVFLALAIAAMFYITLKSEQPNILNYEKVLTDRYASWEQELTNREQAIREKERELQINQ